MSHRDEQAALIAALFKASQAPDAPPWGGLLEALAGVTRASGAALSVMVDTLQQWNHGTCATLTPDTVRHMRIDRVYAEDSLPGPERPGGTVRAIKVALGRTGHAVLHISRDAHQRAFRSADAQHLSALAPFLGQAVSARRALSHERACAALSARVARGVGAGWLVFDRGGVILELSAGAIAWGRRHGLRLDMTRRLDLPDPEAAAALRRAWAMLAAGASRVVVALTQAPRSELVLISQDWMDQRAVLGLLREAPRVAAMDIAQVAVDLGLNRSEARLVAHLCDGDSLREAALHLGWTEETARSTSKQVYARLGVAGQTGMIRHVLGGALWLA